MDKLAIVLLTLWAIRPQCRTYTRGGEVDGGVGGTGGTGGQPDPTAGSGYEPELGGIGAACDDVSQCAGGLLAWCRDGDCTFHCMGADCGDGYTCVHPNDGQPYCWATLLLDFPGEPCVLPETCQSQVCESGLCG